MTDFDVLYKSSRSYALVSQNPITATMLADQIVVMTKDPLHRVEAGPCRYLDSPPVMHEDAGIWNLWARKEFLLGQCTRIRNILPGYHPVLGKLGKAIMPIDANSYV